MSDEINPNHQVTAMIHDHWHKMAALLMQKMGTNRVIITLDDINRLSEADVSIVFHGHRDTLELRLVGREEADKRLSCCNKDWPMILVGSPANVEGAAGFQPATCRLVVGDSMR